MYLSVYTCVCPFIVDLRLIGHRLVNTFGQDLMTGSPTRVKMAFHNSVKTAAQHTVKGQGLAPMMQQGTKPFCLQTQEHLTDSILTGLLLSFALRRLCRYRCCQTWWICSSVVTGVAEGQSIHLMSRRMASLQSCQWVDVLRSIHCGD